MSDSDWTLEIPLYRVKLQFENLRQYYNEIGKMIKSWKEDLIKNNDELQNDLKNRPREMEGIYDDFYADNFFVLNIEERTFCFSFIISIYTLIEKYLNQICKAFGISKNIPITCKDLYGDGVTRAKKYLEKLCDINFDNKDSEFLNVINAIRNVIAHEYGELDNTTEKNIEKIHKFSQNVPGCIIRQTMIYADEKGQTIDAKEEIELEFSFVEYCLEQGEKLFDNINKQLPLTSL
jgi:hypothetical protein